MERKVTEWGCMQALIDFDGWRKWKNYDGTTMMSGKAKTERDEKEEKAAARAALRAAFAKGPPSKADREKNNNAPVASVAPAAAPLLPTTNVVPATPSPVASPPVPATPATMGRKRLNSSIANGVSDHYESRSTHTDRLRRSMASSSSGGTSGTSDSSGAASTPDTAVHHVAAAAAAPPGPMATTNGVVQKGSLTLGGVGAS